MDNWEEKRVAMKNILITAYCLLLVSCMEQANYRIKGITFDVLTNTNTTDNCLKLEEKDFILRTDSLFFRFYFELEYYQSLESPIKSTEQGIAGAMEHITKCEISTFNENERYLLNEHLIHPDTLYSYQIFDNR